MYTQNKIFWYIFTTKIEYKRVMYYQLIIEEFGPNIKYIPVFENIVYYELIRLPPSINNQEETATIKSQYFPNTSLATR